MGKNNILSIALMICGATLLMYSVAMISYDMAAVVQYAANGVVYLVGGLALRCGLRFMSILLVFSLLVLAYISSLKLENLDWSGFGFSAAGVIIAFGPIILLNLVFVFLLLWPEKKND